MRGIMQRILRLVVNVGWLGLPFHSQGAQPEREAFPPISSVRMSRRRTPRILLLVVGLLVAASSSVVLADGTADTLLQRALYLSDLYNWRAARPYFTKSQQMFEASRDNTNAPFPPVGRVT